MLGKIMPYLTLLVTVIVIFDSGTDAVRKMREFVSRRRNRNRVPQSYVCPVCGHVLEVGSAQPDSRLFHAKVGSHMLERHGDSMKSTLEEDDS